MPVTVAMAERTGRMFVLNRSSVSLLDSGSCALLHTTQVDAGLRALAVERAWSATPSR